MVPDIQHGVDLASCVINSVQTQFKWCLNILTDCPSLTPFGLSLGSTNPGRTNLPQETLDFRRLRFSRSFSLLIPASSLLLRPALLTVRLHPTAERSPTKTTELTVAVYSFGYKLKPRSLLAQNRIPYGINRPVSCYALFK